MSVVARIRRSALVVAAIVLAVGLAVAIRAIAGTPDDTASARTVPATGAHPAAGAHAAGDSTPAATWVEGWAAAQSRGGISIADRTIRMIVHNTVPGSQVRLRLSNQYGTRPLVVGAVDIAAQDTGGDAVPGSVRLVTFGGSATPVIPAGAQVTSDPVAMTVTAGENLLVSLYAPDPTAPSGWHFDAHEVTYLSAPGNFAAASDTAGYSVIGGVTGDAWYYLDGLDVLSVTARCTLVAFGDSITNGFGSIMSSNSSWPDLLAERLADLPGGPAFGVVDEGLDGNRVLTDTSGAYGVSGLHRFTQDALDQTGVRDVIVLEGINDIGTLRHRTTKLTAQDLINGYLAIIGEAHAAGVKIYGATILPYQGAFYYTSAGESVREAVNQWILTSGAFDGVFDFAAAVQDPLDQYRLEPLYNSSDDLHPSSAGYQAIADSIDLSELTC